MIIKSDAVILESTSNISKKGNAYTICLIRIEGKVMKIFSDKNLDDYVDKEVTLSLSLSPNQDMFAGLRILDVEK